MAGTNSAKPANAGFYFATLASETRRQQMATWEPNLVASHSHSL